MNLAGFKNLKYHAGPAHGQNLWRGNSLRKLKLLGGQPEGQCSKIKDIGGAAALPLPPALLLNIF